MKFIKKIWRETLLCVLLGGVIYLMYYWTVARPADRFVQSYMLLGIAGGIGEGLLFKKGEIIRKVPEGELLSVLRSELLNWKQD